MPVEPTPDPIPPAAAPALLPAAPKARSPAWGLLELALLLLIGIGAGALTGIGEAGYQTLDSFKGNSAETAAGLLLFGPFAFLINVAGGILFGGLQGLLISAAPALVVSLFNAFGAQPFAGARAPSLRWALRLVYVGALAVPVVLIMTAPQVLEPWMLEKGLIQSLPDHAPPAMRAQRANPAAPAPGPPRVQAIAVREETIPDLIIGSVVVRSRRGGGGQEMAMAIEGSKVKLLKSGQMLTLTASTPSSTISWGVPITTWHPLPGANGTSSDVEVVVAPPKTVDLEPAPAPRRFVGCG